jgi:hypothetical protein
VIERLLPLKAVTVRRFGFPHTAQVIQVTRRVCELRSRRWRTVVVYAVTSLAHAQASPLGSLTLSGGTGRSRTVCTTYGM